MPSRRSAHVVVDAVEDGHARELSLPASSRSTGKDLAVDHARHGQKPTGVVDEVGHANVARGSCRRFVQRSWQCCRMPRPARAVCCVSECAARDASSRSNSLRARAGDDCASTDTPPATARDRHFVLVAAELANAASYPPQRRRRSISCSCWRAAAARAGLGEETLRTEPIVDRDDDALGAERLRAVVVAPLISATDPPRIDMSRADDGDGRRERPRVHVLETESPLRTGAVSASRSVLCRLVAKLVASGVPASQPQAAVAASRSPYRRKPHTEVPGRHTRSSGKPAPRHDTAAVRTTGGRREPPAPAAKSALAMEVWSRPASVRSTTRRRRRTRRRAALRSDRGPRGYSPATRYCCGGSRTLAGKTRLPGRRGSDTFGSTIMIFSSVTEKPLGALAVHRRGGAAGARRSSSARLLAAHPC